MTGQDATLAARVKALAEGLSVLHQRQPSDSPFNSEGRDVCGTCMDGHAPADWPCPTITLLNAPEPDTRAEYRCTCGPNGTPDECRAELAAGGWCPRPRPAPESDARAERVECGQPPSVCRAFRPALVRAAPAVAEGTDARLTDDEREALALAIWPVEAERDPGRRIAYRDTLAAVERIIAARLAQRAPRAEDADVLRDAADALEGRNLWEFRKWLRDRADDLTQRDDTTNGDQA